MIAAYDRILETVSQSLSILGLTLTSSDDYIAKFSAPDGRAVELRGDRYAAPAFLIAVVTGAHGRPFSESLALNVLMKTFSSQIVEERKISSLENQLWFLRNFESVLFAIKQGDKTHSAYNAINEDLSYLD